MTHKERENIRKQKSVFFYTEMVKYDPIVRNTSPHGRELYTSMLVQDVCSKVVPYKNNVKVILTGENKEFEQIIANGIGHQNYSSITSAVRRFFNTCIGEMFEYGKATYELVYLVNPETNKAVGFDLAFIRPNTVFSFWGNTFQYVPPIVAKEYRVPIFIRLNNENILRFNFTSAMEKTVRTTMKELSFISENSIPPFIDFRDKGIHYSFDDFQIANQLALAEATQEMGWDARKLIEDNSILEFYQIYRYIKFAKFAVELRALLLETLNRVVQQIGKSLGYTGDLEIVGLVTKEELDKAMNDLYNGKITFKEIYEKIL